MDLKQLGSRTPIPVSPDKAVLEFIPFAEAPVCIRFQVPEFVSRCPITGAPDFARIIIDYVPSTLLLESKSAKLYFNAFIGHGAFHEQIAVLIGNRLWAEAKPTWLRVCAFFNARGGIPLDVFYTRGEKPNSLYIPDPDLNPFRGR